MIRTLEEVSTNAWPSLQTMLLDGWLLRFAGGYTRRANSVHPLYAGTEPLDAKIQRVEALYRQRKQKVIFKLTAAAEPPNLDELLDARGYRIDAPTSVQTLGLRGQIEQPNQEIALSPDRSDAWLAAYSRMSELDNARQQLLTSILGNIAPATCFGSIVLDDKIVACGMAVLQDGYLGLFDVITDRDVRGRGYGRLLLLNLLAWGKQQAGVTAYLQVMVNNTAAQSLYGGIGFREAYRYWYRVLDV